MASPSPINLYGWAGAMAELFANVDHRSPHPYPVIQDIEQYRASHDKRHFALCVSRVVPGKSVISVRTACPIPPWGPGLNDSVIQMDAMRCISIIFTEALTGPSFIVVRRWGMSGALETSWGICRRPHSLIDLNIWSRWPLYPFSKTAFTWFLTGCKALAMYSLNSAYTLTIGLPGVLVQHWVVFSSACTSRRAIHGMSRMVGAFQMLSYFFDSDASHDCQLYEHFYWWSPRDDCYLPHGRHGPHIQALMQLLSVAESSGVGYVYHDPCMIHDDCSVTSSLSSDVRCRIDHHVYFQFVTECSFDPFPAYLEYWQSAEIDRSSFCPSNCYFSYTFARDQAHRLLAPEVTWHKHTSNDKLAPPQILAACVITWANDESNGCIIAAADAYLDLFPRSEEAIPSVPPASPGVAVEELDENLDAEVNWDLSDTTLSEAIDVCSTVQADFPIIQGRCDEFSTDCSSNAGTRSNWRYVAWTLSMSHASSCPALTGCILICIAQQRACSRLSIKLQHIAALTSVRGDMAPLEESVDVAQRQLPIPIQF